MRHSNGVVTATYLDQWQRDGYLVLPGVFDPGRLAALRSVCDGALDQWKRESRPEVEPHDYAYGPTAWSMLHLNHPKYHRTPTPTGSPGSSGSLATLLSAIAEPSLLTVLRELLRDEPLMEQVNYYINPYGDTRRGPWHRDCQFFAPDEATERRLLAEQADPPQELHMHIPFVPTAATEVVPGSHTRWDEPEETNVRRRDFFSDQMPGALTLHLNPGDVAFFHVNALHRGLYSPDVLRRTIAVTWATHRHHRPITREGLTNWKGYVALYQPWFLDPGYLDGVAVESRGIYEAEIEAMRDEWQQPGLLDGLTPERRSYFSQR